MGIQRVSRSAGYARGLRSGGFTHECGNDKGADSLLSPFSLSDLTPIWGPSAWELSSMQAGYGWH